MPRGRIHLFAEGAYKFICRGGVPIYGFTLTLAQALQLFPSGAGGVSEEEARAQRIRQLEAAIRAKVGRVGKDVV